MNKKKLTSSIRPSKASKINKIELNKKIKRKMSDENRNENQLRRSDRLRQKREIGLLPVNGKEVINGVDPEYFRCYSELSMYYDHIISTIESA